MKRAFLLYLVLCLASIAQAAITLDATANSGTQTVGTAITWSHTITSCTNEVLLVVVQINDAGTPDSVSAITWNGGTMGAAVYNDSVTNFRLEWFKLVAPTTGTHNMSVTVSGGASVGWVGTSVSLCGVDQTTPLETHASATITAASTATVSLTTLTNGAWYISALIDKADTGGVQTITVADSATQLANVVNDTTGNAVTGRKLIATAGATSPTDTVTPQSVTGLMDAVDVKPAAAASSPTAIPVVY